MKAALALFGALFLLSSSGLTADPAPAPAAAAATQIEGFPIRFLAYDLGNLAKKIPPSFQIFYSRTRPSEFLELGQSFASGKVRWTLTKFERKEQANSNGEKQDASELTIVNNDTKESLVLPLGRVVNSPAAPAR